MVGLQGVGMVHLSCKALHWYADRLCSEDLWGATAFVSLYVMPICL